METNDEREREREIMYMNKKMKISIKVLLYSKAIYLSLFQVNIRQNFLRDQNIIFTFSKIILNFSRNYIT